MSVRMVSSALVVALVACGGSEESPSVADARSADADADANAAPVANAGPDQRVGQGATVTLDGRDSQDPELVPLAFAWSVASSPPASTAVLDDPDTATPAIELAVPGLYVFILTVSDGELASHPDAVAVTVVDGVPIADAGNDRSVPHGTRVVLDGSTSFDPEASALSYAWTMTARPAGSTAVLDDPSAALPRFTADLVGAYELELRVDDGMSSSGADHVIITATNAAPVVSAGGDALVTLGSTVELVGTATDLEGDPLSITWTLTESPAASTSNPSPATALATAIAIDEPGRYRLTLTVSDGLAVSTDEVVIGTANDAIALTHDVLDVEYSRSLDRLVMLSADTGNLSILDPETGLETTVVLSTAPLSVSLAPNGLHAAIGHADGSISVVDLIAAAVTTALPTATVAGEITHGGNGFVYVIPETGGSTTMRSVSLATGVATATSGPLFNGSHARRHPVEAAIYVADRTGISPARLHKWSTAGVASFVSSSPVSSGNPICGNLWLSEDGARVFTACGRVFRAGDLMLNTSLPDLATRVTSLDHSAAAGLVAVIPADPPTGEDGLDTRIDLYADGALAFDHSIALAAFVAGEWTAPNGRFAFFSADGTALYVVMTAAPSSGVPRTLVWRAL